MSNENVILITLQQRRLGRCKSERSKAKLQERMTQFLHDKEHKFHDSCETSKEVLKLMLFYVADVSLEN